jgi:hypothetical protein
MMPKIIFKSWSDLLYFEIYNIYVYSMLKCGLGQSIIMQSLNKSFDIKTNWKNKLKGLRNLLQKMSQNNNTINFWKLPNFIFNLGSYIFISPKPYCNSTWWDSGTPY